MNLRVLFAVCVALAATPAALAQTPDTLKKAQSAFDQAQLDYLAGKYDEAAKGFEDAYNAHPFPQFLYNVGASWHMKGKKASDVEAYGKAVTYYKRYLDEEKQASDKAKVEKTIGVLEAEIQRIKDSAAGSGAGSAGSGSAAPATAPSQEVQQLGDVKVHGLVVIESEPQGATIYLDDKKKASIGTTPWSGALDGEHKVIVEKRGYRVGEGVISADPSKLFVKSFSLAQASYLGWVDVTSNVPGADVFLDDKSVGAVGKTPFSQNIPPGKHTFWISADGYDEFTVTVDIPAGETQQVKGTLKGSPVGRLTVTGMGLEGASITLDGKPLCNGPCTKNVTQGEHDLGISNDGFKSYHQKIDVVAKTETSVKVVLSPSPGHGDAIAAYVVSAVFGGAGIYLGLQSQGIHDDIKKAIDAGNPPPDSNDPRLLKGKIYAIAADGTFAIAGITLITAIYYTFRDTGRPSTGMVDVRALTLTPQVGPTYAGLGMEMTW